MTPTHDVETSGPPDTGGAAGLFMTDEDDLIDLTPPPSPGHRKITIKIGDVLYRAVTFDGGAIRFWNVANVRAVGRNSVVLEPYRTPGARAQADEDARAEWRP